MKGELKQLKIQLIKHIEKLVKINPWRFESIEELAMQVKEKFPEAAVGGIIREILRRRGENRDYIKIIKMGKEKVLKDAIEAAKYNNLKTLTGIAKHLVSNHPDYEGMRYTVLETTLAKHEEVDILEELVKRNNSKPKRENELAKSILNNILKAEKIANWEKNRSPDMSVKGEYDAYPHIVKDALYHYLARLRRRGFTPEERMERLIALGIPPADAEDIVTEEPLRRLHEYSGERVYKEKSRKRK